MKQGTRHGATLLTAFALGGCGGKAPPPPTAVAETAPPTAPSAVRRLPPSADWRRMATDADRYRLREWRTAWVTAFGRARMAGSTAPIAAQGPLFDPDFALDRPTPPPGEYRCRTFKVGANGTAVAEFKAYGWYACRIADEGEVKSLVKIGGTQRPVGLIFADGPSRAIFLGTMALSDEERQLDYGRDPGRDMIGAVERVAPQRWRLVLPYPKFESIVDVMELVPAD